jgi:hypothetical protein
MPMNRRGHLVSEGDSDMPLLAGILLIIVGLGVLGFGLFLFYGLLPLFYAFAGLGIGLLLGEALTGNFGLIAIVLGILGAVILGGASYSLEPYRRILLGLSGGALVGLAIASWFGLDGLVGGFFGAILGVVGGVIGAVVVLSFFDPFIIASSAIGGAIMVMTGAHLILPTVNLFDRSTGGFWPTLITLILAVIGVGWQYSNITKWVRTTQWVQAIDAVREKHR